MHQGLAVASRPHSGQWRSFYVLWALSHPVGWGLLPLITWALHPHDLGVFLTNESMSFGMSDALPSFVVSGLVLGVAQWLLLRHIIDRAAWWVAATVIGWSIIAATSFLGVFFGGGILPSLRVTAYPYGTSFTTWALPAAEGMVAGGLINGLMLGAVLVLL